MNKWIYLALFLLLTPFAWGVEKELKRGDIAFTEGKYSEARDSYRKAVIDNPKSVAAHLALGHALFALGEYTYAFVELRKGLEFHAAPRQIHPDLTRYYPNLDEFERKLKKLAGKVAAKPDDVPQKFVYAYVCYFSGRKKQAHQTLLDLKKRTKFSQKNRKWVLFFLNQLNERDQLVGDTIFMDAYKAFQEGRYYKAYSNFRRVIHDQPSLGIPRLLIAHSFFALGYYKLAYKYVETGLFFRPHDKIVNSQWRSLYKNDGEWMRLLIALEGHVNVHQDDRQAQQLLAFMYYCFKKRVQSRQVVRRLAEDKVVTPVLATLHSLLQMYGTVTVAKSEKKTRPAKTDENKKKPVPKVAKKVEKKEEPENKGGITYKRFRILGKSYFKKGRFELATVAFNSMIPDDDLAYYEVAYSYFAQGLYDQAGSRLQEGLLRNQAKEVPPMDEYFASTSEILSRKQGLEQYLKRETDPQQVSVLYGLVELELGQSKRALKHLVKHLVKYPKDQAATHLLARVKREIKSGNTREDQEVNRLIAKVKKLTEDGENKKEKTSPREMGNKDLLHYQGKRYRLYRGSDKVKGAKIITHKGRRYILVGKDKKEDVIAAAKKGDSSDKKGKPAVKKKAPPAKISIDLNLEGIRAEPETNISPDEPLDTPSK